MKTLITVLASVTFFNSSAFAGGAENLLHDLSTSRYEISTEGDDCSLLLQYNSWIAAGNSASPIYINAKLENGEAEIYSQVDIKSVVTNGNALVLNQRVSAFKKSHIVIYVDQFGKPLKAEGQARRYFQSAKINCVFK